MIKFQITGQSEIAKALQGLPSRIAKNVAMQAMAEAVQPVVNAARLLAPVGETGGLKRSIGFAVRQYRRGRITYGVIGARRGFGVPDPSLKSGFTEPANYAHLVEDGHAVAGNALAWVEPKPFLRPAWDANQRKVVENLSESLGAGIEAEAALIAQKHAKKDRRAAAKALKRRARQVALGAPV